MKKIIWILGVTLIAVTMFFNSNKVNFSRSNNDLSGIIEMNTAHADGEENTGKKCYNSYNKGDEFTILYCPDCSTVTAKNYSDPGTCGS